MTDFAGRVLRPEGDDWIIRSRLDIDFYKLTMGSFIFARHRGVRVRFSLINRHTHVPLARIIDEGELRRQLDHARTLLHTRTDLYYLRGMDIYGQTMFSEDYLSFLGSHRLPEYDLRRTGDQYELDFECDWEDVSPWETIALAIISELFYRSLMESLSPMEVDILYARAKNALYQKLLAIKSRPWIRFADFGQRRRHSFLWQKYAVEMARDMLGEQFTGTSNTWMAFNQDLVPIGTNAHELPMVLTALADTDEEKRMAQYGLLREWGEFYPQNALRIMLPDTYGTAQFLTGMPADLAEEVARSWRGMRQDSGDPIREGEQYLNWLDARGVEPMRTGKILIPSDGLDIATMYAIDDAFEGRIQHPFGWGTNFTNGFEDCHPRPDEQAVVRGERLSLTNAQLFRGHSIVCKVTAANERPCVKLSNDISKATGPADEIERYLRIFGHAGRTERTVEV